MQRLRHLAIATPLVVEPFESERYQHRHQTVMDRGSQARRIDLRGLAGRLGFPPCVSFGIVGEVRRQQQIAPVRLRAFHRVLQQFQFAVAVFERGEAHPFEITCTGLILKREVLAALFIEQVLGPFAVSRSKQDVHPANGSRTEFRTGFDFAGRT